MNDNLNSFILKLKKLCEDHKVAMSPSDDRMWINLSYEPHDALDRDRCQISMSSQIGSWSDYFRLSVTIKEYKITELKPKGN